MKRIGIDARLYFQTGVGTYLQNLIRYLATRTGNELIFVFFVLQKDYDHLRQLHPNLEFVPVQSRWHSFGEQIELMSVLQKAKLDLMHFTYFSFPVLYTRPFIATVHDLTPLKFKTGKASTKSPFLYELKHQVFRFVLWRQITGAKAIITPTQTVAEDIKSTYAIPTTRITTTYEGVDKGLLEVPEESIELPRLYVVYIGNFYPHKNIRNLIEAFQAVNPDYSLLLVGPNDHFAQGANDFAQQCNIGERVRFMYGVSKGQLKYIYRNASAFVHPSLSEGFGLPVVEAMQFGLPIAASNIPVFDELLGRNRQAFEPTQASDIARVLNKVLEKPRKHDYAQQLQRFDFSVMAEQHYKLYCDTV